VDVDYVDSGIVGSNPAQGMDVYPHLSVLCCAVVVETFRRADPSSRESYQKCCELEQITRPNP
jgi:hypothetical protein